MIEKIARLELMDISDEVLTQMVDELYDWHFNSSGCLDQKGEVIKLAESYFDKDIYLCQDMILREAHNRYDKVVKMLFINNPSIYIDR